MRFLVRFATAPAPQTDTPWQRIHDIAVRAEARFGGDVLAWFDAIRDKVDLEALANALEAGNAAQAEALVMGYAEGTLLQKPLREAIAETVWAAGNSEAEYLTGQIGELAFDTLEPRCITWIRGHGSELIKYINDTQRQAIQDIIRRGFEQGIAPRDMAKLISDHIGLLPQHEAYLAKVAAQMGADGASKEEIAKWLMKNRKRLLKYRAEMIARTETIRAAIKGQQLAWQQAQAEGLLGPEALQEWITTPDERLCPQCAAMDGMTAPLGAPFVPGIEGPPDPHPQCRCALGLLPHGLADRQPIT